MSKATKIIIGERVSFVKATGKHNNGLSAPSKSYGTVTAFGDKEKGVVIVKFDDGDECSLRKKQI